MRAFAESGTRFQLRDAEEWSGRVDLNHRPPGPEPGALARLRYAPTVYCGAEQVYDAFPRTATARRFIHESHTPILRLQVPLSLATTLGDFARAKNRAHNVLP